MKKFLIFPILLLLITTGCAKTSIKQKDIKGYWQQIESNWSGEIDDMSDDPYAYLEITDKKLYFYNESSTQKGYYETVAEKNYILENNKLYYDYEEFKKDNWKDNISVWGGIFEVSFDGDNLILTEYTDDKNMYQKSTYQRVNEEDRLLEP